MATALALFPTAQVLPILQRSDRLKTPFGERAFERRTAMKLASAPIDFLVREVRESAIAMSRAALNNLGAGQGEIERLEDHFRENERLRLAEQAATGDLHAGDERIIRPGAVVPALAD